MNFSLLLSLRCAERASIDTVGAPTGSMNKEKSFELLDAFVEAGGNFIDTANAYQSEESEEYIGEWMARRKIRDRMVIATKYSVRVSCSSQVGEELTPRVYGRPTTARTPLERMRA